MQAEGDDEALKELREKAEKGEAAAQRLYEMERDGVIDKAIEAGKLVPADRDKWVARYDEIGAETTTEIINDLPVNETLVSEYGSDEGGAADGEEESLYRGFSAILNGGGSSEDEGRAA